MDVSTRHKAILQQRETGLLNWLKNVLKTDSITIELISGDASFRRYFRVRGFSTSLIAVDAPPPNESAQVFVCVAEAYRRHGVRVPDIKGTNERLGFMLLEDFGDNLLLPCLTEHNKDYWYSASLAQIESVAQVTETSLGELPRFDRPHIEKENAIFTEWLLGEHLSLTLSEHNIQMFKQCFDILIENALAQPQVGMHRDYHARNIMLLPESKIGIIDFQDAVIGPITYDVVSLLRDCYIVWPDEWVYEKLEQWSKQCHVANRLKGVSRERLIRWFDLTGLQRHIKASGIFCRLFHRDGKSGYLKDVPTTLEYITRIALKYDEFIELGHFVKHEVMPAWEART